MKSYLDLDAWAVGLDLLEEIYLLTSTFPHKELYGMTSQMRRASASILANLAEGFGRYTFADKANKYTIARGECTEVEAFLYMSVRVKFLDPIKIQKALALVERERKLLSGLIEATRHRT